MFKTFPEFSKLTLADKAEYEALIKDYPPVCDISFAILMTWWEPLGEVKVSRLNDNLVISYWVPGDEEHSGLSLIGTHEVEESICAIFDFLREQGKWPRLVNVPEFVVHNLRFPELFVFRADRANDEYLIPLKRFSTKESLLTYMQHRVKKFEDNWGKDNIEVKNVSLYSRKHRELLLELSSSWPKKGLNSLTKSDYNMLQSSITHGAALDMQSICLYINGKLQAYCVYAGPYGEHILVLTARLNYDFPRIFDYMVYRFSAALVSAGVRYANLGPDGGSLVLRTIKIALKPDNFYRKYIIEPSGSRHVLWPLSKSRHYY